MNKEPYVTIKTKANDTLAYFESNDPDEIAKMDAMLVEAGFTEPDRFIELEDGAKATYFPKEWIDFGPVDEE